MSFLITGATGFVGKKVVEIALGQGNQVAVLTRSISTAEQFFPNKNVKIYDLTKFLSGEEKIDIKKYDKLIHLGWADVKNYMDENNSLENLEFQKHLLNNLINSGVRDITVSGSCLEYGMNEGACDEDIAAKQPITSYADAKIKLYEYLKEKQKSSSELKIKWMRFFYVYGIGSRPNSLLSQLLKAIENGDSEFNMSPGDQQRDFISLDCLTKNVIAIAGQNEVDGIINIGNGKPVAVSDFVVGILKLRNSKIKLNKGFYPYAKYEPHSFWADITKLKSIKNTVFDKNFNI